MTYGRRIRPIADDRQAEKVFSIHLRASLPDLGPGNGVTPRTIANDKRSCMRSSRACAGFSARAPARLIDARAPENGGKPRWRATNIKLEFTEALFSAYGRLVHWPDEHSHIGRRRQDGSCRLRRQGHLVDLRALAWKALPNWSRRSVSAMIQSYLNFDDSFSFDQSGEDRVKHERGFTPTIVRRNGIIPRSARNGAPLERRELARSVA
jgi:hypothetical protein